jgi:hypothetical protein
MTNTAERLGRVFASGFVQRYSTNPSMAWAGQTNGHHQWGVAVLLLGLFGDRVNLAAVWEALHHDTGEVGVCDMSLPAKQKYRSAAFVVADAEANERVEMGVPKAVLTCEEADMLKLCDRLESLLFARVRTPWVLMGGGWPELQDAVLRDAERLGVFDVVAGLLRGPVAA